MDARPVSAAEASKLLDPLGRYSHLAIAVSGGADSLALLQLISRWRDGRGAKPDLTVLTVDHGLRAQSRDEAEMVADVAARLGLAHAILAWDGAKPGEGGLQERARAARYDLMAAYCHAHGIPALVTAHHLDDQAETFLMRLKRGSGLDGLAAIPEASVWAGIAVHRPLLDLSKARLAATLQEAGLGWAEDPSNEDRRFERVRVRADRDALTKLGLPPESLARSARRLRRARAALERGTDEFLAKHAAVNEAGFCTIAPEALAAAPEEIALRALARVLASVGGRPEPIRLSKLETLLSALAAQPNKTHTLGGCRIAPHGNRLGVFRETRRGRPAGIRDQAGRAGAVGQPLQRRTGEERIGPGHRARLRAHGARGPRLGAMASGPATLCPHCVASLRSRRGAAPSEPERLKGRGQRLSRELCRRPRRFDQALRALKEACTTLV